MEPKRINTKKLKTDEHKKSKLSSSASDCKESHSALTMLINKLNLPEYFNLLAECAKR